MSGTNKEKPVFARLRSKEIPVREYHMCSLPGWPCDLPEKPQHGSAGWTRCSWEPVTYKGLFSRSKGEQDDARQDRRRTRRRRRASISEGLSDFIDELLD